MIVGNIAKSSVVVITGKKTVYSAKQGRRVDYSNMVSVKTGRDKFFCFHAKECLLFIFL